MDYLAMVQLMTLTNIIYDYCTKHFRRYPRFDVQRCYDGGFAIRYKLQLGSFYAPSVPFCNIVLDDDITLTIGPALDLQRRSSKIHAWPYAQTKQYLDLRDPDSLEKLLQMIMEIWRVRFHYEVLCPPTESNPGSGGHPHDKRDAGR